MVNDGTCPPTYASSLCRRARLDADIEDDGSGDRRIEEGELMCLLQPGEVLMIMVDVRPPYGATIEDEFRFTLSVEPKDGGVFTRENVELSVTGIPDEGLGLIDGTKRHHHRRNHGRHLRCWARAPIHSLSADFRDMNAANFHHFGPPSDSPAPFLVGATWPVDGRTKIR